MKNCTTYATAEAQNKQGAERRLSQEGALQGAECTGAPAQPFVCLQAVQMLLGSRQQRLLLLPCAYTTMLIMVETWPLTRFVQKSEQVMCGDEVLQQS